MLVGPYTNGKTMMAERFAVAHLRTSQRVWIAQTREGAGRKAEQLDRLLASLKPRVLILDEFRNALQGRARGVQEAVFAFLRRIGRQYHISPAYAPTVSLRDPSSASDRKAR